MDHLAHHLPQICECHPPEHIDIQPQLHDTAPVVRAGNAECIAILAMLAACACNRRGDGDGGGGGESSLVVD